MKKDFRGNNIRKLICGALCGFCNGLFGAGGGIIAVFSLKKLLGMDEKCAHACAICIMLPLSLVSIAGYIWGGAVDFSVSAYIVPAFFTGSIAGAYALGKLRNIWLNRLFCLLSLASAVFMIVL